MVIKYVCMYININNVFCYVEKYEIQRINDLLLNTVRYAFTASWTTQCVSYNI